MRPFSTALLLAFIAVPATAQVGGPSVDGGAAPGLGLPMIDRPNGPNRRLHPDQGTPLPTPPPAPASDLDSCLKRIDDDPEAAMDTANEWLQRAAGDARAEAGLCLGSAHAAQDQWPEATAAFLAARDAAGTGDHLLRARLGGMAGNAALADGSPVSALTALDAAHAEALAIPDAVLAGEIALDRARALVALKREGDASAALAEARTANPGSAIAWLLSATLARRLDHLVEAQTDIETAARLAPVDPDIGLEAGVIAMLAGHADAARKSWQSVIAAAPDGDAGRRARDYLSQLPPDPAPSRPAGG